MKHIITTLTGSRAHGLHHEGSDYDWRGVFSEPLIKHISPFQKVKNNHWIEDREDDTSYELSHFIKGCCQCNPNFLEVVWATPKEGLTIADVWLSIFENRHKFLDSKRILDAHIGYSKNQENKMNLHTPDERTAKYAVAYIRSLDNAVQLLEDREINLDLRGRELHQQLYGIKYHFLEYKPLAIELFAEYQKRVNAAYERNPDMTPDIAFWETLLLEYYCTNGNRV